MRRCGFLRAFVFMRKRKTNLMLCTAIHCRFELDSAAQRGRLGSRLWRAQRCGAADVGVGRRAASVCDDTARVRR